MACLNDKGVLVELTGGNLSVWLVLLPEKSLSLWLVLVVSGIQ